MSGPKVTGSLARLLHYDDLDWQDPEQATVTAPQALPEEPEQPAHRPARRGYLAAVVVAVGVVCGSLGVYGGTLLHGAPAPAPRPANVTTPPTGDVVPRLPESTPTPVARSSQRRPQQATPQPQQRATRPQQTPAPSPVPAPTPDPAVPPPAPEVTVPPVTAPQTTPTTTPPDGEQQEETTP